MTSEARKRQPPTVQQLHAARATITKIAGIVGLHIEDDNDDVLLMVAGDVGRVLAEAVEIVGRHQNAPRPILTCSSEGCTKNATETLTLRGIPGHVHDCAEHAHDLREFCDITASAPINADGSCPADVCTGNRLIWFGNPTPLPEADPS